MKVCVFGTRGFPGMQGGVEKHCESLYPNMPQGICFDVCRRKSFVTDSKKYPNINFVDIKNTEKRGLEATFHSFISSIYAIKTKPDVVHIHNIGPAMFAPILKLFGQKVVLTYHSANYEHKKWSKPEKLVLKMSEHFALKYSDRIIFVNKEQMSKYSSKIIAKSCYIPNGVNPPVDTSDTSFLQEHNLQRQKYILSVGRITPEKGFDTLIKAFYKSGLNNEYKLAIVGGVEFEDSYKKELNSLVTDDSVVFTGFADGERLAQLYKNARLYVLASNNEGFPLVMLEAMSYGLNLLASDISATRMIDLGKETYFPAGDYNILAEKMKKAINSDYTEVKYDLSQYNWKSIANKVASIYRELKK